MRILFTFVGGNGHFQPLVPIAQAVAATGHSIRFACTHTMRGPVEKYSFPTSLLGTPSPTTATPEIISLRPLDPEREDQDLRENFARRAATARIPQIIGVCAEWKPDVIVCDEVDFGAMLVAEYLHIPHVPVIVIAAGSFVRPEVVAEPLAALRNQYGLPADPTVAMPNHYLTLAPIPPSYRNPAFPPPATTHALKPFVKPNPPPPLPFVKQDSTLPTVYFTLGTVFNLESGDLFSRVLTALQTVAVNAVVTVGTHIDPSTFGVQPPHIHITQYLPQLSVLPHCDMVISHGGSGTVIASLAHGLPLLIIPMGADQPHNAERCQALGVGRMLDPLTATTDKISEALFSLLGESRYRMAAQRLAQEIEMLPDPAYVVELLERLHNDKQPVINR